MVWHMTVCLLKRKSQEGTILCVEDLARVLMHSTAVLNIIQLAIGWKGREALPYNVIFAPCRTIRFPVPTSFVRKYTAII